MSREMHVPRSWSEIECVGAGVHARPLPHGCAEQRGLRPLGGRGRPPTQNSLAHAAFSTTTDNLLQPFSARRINARISTANALWQEESFDHVMRSSESLDAKIAYILANPVRGGLTRLLFAREFGTADKSAYVRNLSTA